MREIKIMFSDVKLMHPHDVFDILFLSIACIISGVYFDIPSERDVKINFGSNLAIMP